MLRTRSPRKEKISNCYLHSNSLSNKMDNSLLAVRDINHKYIVVDQEMETLSEKYTYARPFTKESLLYREIFEKYYPGQAEMIAGFWMPNKEWEGCDVNDPSARVLSNYGESGK